MGDASEPEPPAGGAAERAIAPTQTLDLPNASELKPTIPLHTEDAPATVKLRGSRPDVADHAQLVTVDRDNYVIGSEIARGGMGRIVMARDRRLGREVAIKELLVFTTEHARRFEREARITARLQHPSIVGVHEAGRWSNGEPFYAMKLVSGRSLHDAIKAARTLAERIALVPNVLAVADAIAYAHAQRVIHRDLKPTNVILGEFGETVVIDWGIAKSVDDRDTPSTAIAASGDIGTQTVVGAVLGTPGFMPPEQAEGQAIDERVDVFAIGAMLYMTLVGKPAFRGSKEDIAAAMKTGATPIAELVPGVPRDLAAIAERAMATDLAVRYRDARELADDLRRFQTGQLVGAHHYSRGQLVSRWLRRHRTAVTVGAVAFVALAVVGALSVRSVVQSRGVAERQRVRAEKRSGDAEDAMGFMLFELADKLRQAGRIELMDTVVRRAIDYYDHTKDEDVDPTRLVAALDVIGDVLRAEGDLVAALREYRRAEAIAQAHLGEGAAWRHHLATTENALGETVYAQGDLASALAYHRRSLSLAEALVAEAPSDPAWQRDLATSERLAATVLEDQGDVDGALAYLQAAAAIRKQLAARPDANREAARDLMVVESDLALGLARHHDLDGAIEHCTGAIAMAHSAITADPRAAVWQRDAAVAHERLGQILLLRGNRDGALVEFRRNLDMMETLVAIDTANADWQRRLATAHERVGATLLDLGDAAGALAELATSRDMRTALVQRDPTNARWQRDLSVVTVKLGDAELARGDATAALAMYRDAHAQREKLAARDATSVKSQADLFSTRRRIGNALFASGDRGAASRELEAAAALAKDVLSRDPSAIDDADLVELHDRIADIALANGDRARARTELAAAIELSERRAAREPDDPQRGALVAKLKAKLTQ